MMAWTLFVTLVLILINALYVAAEFAVVGVRASRVEPLAAQGHRAAAGLLPILNDPAALDRCIAACQIGITLSSLVLGAFGQATLGVALGAVLASHGGLEPLAAYSLAATVTLVGLTCIQVVFGELIPKTVALQYPLGSALLAYRPLRWSLALYAPFIRLLNGSGSWVLQRLGVTGEISHRHIHAPEEIDLLIRESREGGLLEDQESARLREALQLGQHRVRQLMVPRRQISGLDLNDPVDGLLAQIDASPYTRLLAYSGDFDDIRGYLHVKDVVAALASGRPLTDLQSLVRPILVLPSSLTIDRALGELRAQRARVALLVDEYGDLEGLISLEDIVRELLGELSDEFKLAAEPEPTALPDGRWRLPGRLPLAQAMAWAQSQGGPAWPPSEAETLAGWLLERLERIPEGECALIAAGFLFEIERMDGAAIESVLARRLDAGERATHA